MRDIYYRPTGYYSNPKSLRDACKKEGYRFHLNECRNFLEQQESYQTNKSSSKHIPRVSYEWITRPNCVHQCDILFLTHDRYRRKKYKAVLNIVDCASRYKILVLLRSKKSSEVAKAFRRIYGNQNNPLTWSKLLRYDNGHEFMGKTSRLMQEYNIMIWVIELYNHRDLAMIECFNKTKTNMLYKIQYTVESIISDLRLIKAWIRYMY